MKWTEQSIQLFEAAMAEERRYAEREYSAVKRGDFKDADFAHNMRWRLMDKAVTVLEPVGGQ